MLSILIVSSTNIHPMLSNLSTHIFHIYSSTINFFNPVQESERIKQIRSDIHQFKYNEYQLNFDLTYYPECSSISWDIIPDVNHNPKNFLIYCGNQRNNRLEELTTLLKNDSQLLKKCIPAHINDYSALGATLIRKDIDKQETINFIRTLTAFGFKLTKKDKEIVRLKIYDTLNKNNKTAITLLLNNNEYISSLPEIKKIIMTHMINLHIIDYFGYAFNVNA
jgi:hypothetical protein